MKYFIGIDVAKFKHTACVISQDGEVLVEPFDFSNDALGFDQLLKSIGPYIKEGIVGIEDTGHYGDNLSTFLLDHSVKLAAFNPHITTHMRLAMNVAKNDRLDSINIAQCLMMPNAYRLVSKPLENRMEIRQYTRMHHRRMKEISSYKAQLQKDIDLVFPEYNQLFSHEYSKTYMRILENYPSAEKIAHTDIRSLRTVIRPKGAKGKLPELTADKLKQAAKDSIGNTSIALEEDIKYLVSIINRLTDIVDEIDKKIEEFSITINSPILSIPGVSHFSAMSIISEIGDIANYDSPKRLIKFAGVNPKVYDSGTYSMTRTRIEKKGSSYLRRTLYEIIEAVIRFNPTFQAYCNKKISQGKSRRCVEGHCVRKLLRVIYHLLSTGETFNPDLLV